METTASPAPQRARPIALLAGLVLLGLALRLWLAQGDLWLDEIWSWKLAQGVQRPWDVWRIAHDNNHPLNTLWIALVGDSGSSLAYRALSLVSGTLAIACAWLLGARRGAFAAFACALLAATSTLLCYYSSEARGYAPAVACTFGAWLALERALATGRWSAIAGWWLLVALGLAAHFTFVFVWGALAAGSLPSVLRERGRRGWLELVVLHALPLTLITALYFGFVRGMAYGGGDAWSWTGLWTRALAWTFGTPETLPCAIAGSLLLAAALACELRAGADWRGAALALLLFVPPLVTAFVLKPQFVALRYFILPLACALLLLGQVLGALAARGGSARVLAYALLGAVATLNVVHACALARAGRGHFREALQYMIANTDKPVLSLASDLEFDTRLVVEFHSRGLGKPIAWLPRPGPEGVDWLIVTGDTRPRELVQGGRRYRFERVYEAAGPSAYSWALYRRAQ